MNSRDIKLVVFAGGEPTLLKKRLLDIIQYCSRRGLATRLVTNGAWAKNRKAADKWIAALRAVGLNELNISCDDYHLPYIPFSNVKEAFHAAYGVGFISVVIANCYHSDSIITPEVIMEKLEKRLELRFDASGKSRPIPPPSSDGTIYMLSNAMVTRIGRASNEVDLAKRSTDTSLFDRGCPWAIRSAAVSANNHLVACCGIEAAGNEVLDYGSLANGVTVSDLVAKAQDDVLTNAIIEFGPLFLKKYIQRSTAGIVFESRKIPCVRFVSRLQQIGKGLPS